MESLLMTKQMSLQAVVDEKTKLLFEALAGQDRRSSSQLLKVLVESFIDSKELSEEQKEQLIEAAHQTKKLKKSSSRQQAKKSKAA